MPHRGSLVFTLGRHVQFEMVMRAKTRLEAEIVNIKLEGQDLACNLRNYEGRVSVVEANLEMPSVHDEDHMEMEMYLCEWQWGSEDAQKKYQGSHRHLGPMLG